MKRKFLILITIFVFFAPIQFFAQDLQLRNAYEVAKKLSLLNREPKRYSDSGNTQLLGGIIWYSNLQDQVDDTKLLDSLTTVLPQKYPRLGEAFERIKSNLISYDAFFEIDSNNTAFSKIDNVTIRKSLIDSLKAFLVFKNQLLLTSNLLNSDSSEYKKKLVLLNNCCAKDSSTYNSLVLETNSINALLKSYTTIIELLNKKIEQIKAGTKKILFENQNSLVTFLLAINGVKPNFDNLSVLPENSLNSFLSSQANYQSTIYQQEITPSSFKIPSQSEVIDAIAIYLAKRVKQESVMWFFETLSRNASDNELVNVFFPSTIALLQAKEVYEIPNLSAQWRYTLSKDFVNMPKNVLSNNWLTERYPGMTNYKSYFDGSFAIAELLTEKYSYPDLIRQLYLKNNNSASDKIQFYDFVNFLYCVNTELFLPDSNAHFRMMKYENYRTMSKEEIEIMLSLIDMKYGNVVGKFLDLPNGTFSFTQPQMEQIRKLFGQIEIRVSQIETMLQEFIEQQKKMENDGPKDWFYNTGNIWNSLSDLFTIFNNEEFEKLFSKKLKESNKALRYMGNINEIYNQINRKNFAGAVQSTIAMIDTLFYGNKDESFTIKINEIKMGSLVYGNAKIFGEIINCYNNKDTNRFHFILNTKQETVSFKKTSLAAAIIFERERHSIQLVRKFGSFLNDVALSQNDKQLAKIVESYALPPGSYKRKRNNWWSLDFNAYLGPYGGYEWLKNNESLGQNNKENGFVYGISVPVGISLSKTLGRKFQSDTLSKSLILNPDKIKLKEKNIYERTKSTFTVTVSIIDLGAVVSYRFSNTDSVLPHKITWAQFLSPGIHVGYGLKGTPLVISGGFQYTPELRSFKEIDRQYNAYRLYIGLMFDMPIFNLWERRRIVY